MVLVILPSPLPLGSGGARLGDALASAEVAG
jgi:hypothetical protein